MKKIILIIVAILVFLGIGSGIYLYVNKPKSTTLTSSEITQSNILTTEFLNTFKDNNYTKYKDLSNSKIGTESLFNDVKSTINNNFGTMKDITYKESFTKDNTTLSIYTGDFSKSNTTTFTIGFNKENKITGIRFS